MSEETNRRTSNRARTSRFAARWYRYRNLLAGKWWLVAVMLALGLAAALGWTRWRPRHFISTGRLMANFKAAASEGSVEEMNNFLETQMGLIQGATVINRAHDRLSVGKAATAALPVMLKASVQPKTTIIVLEGTGADPQYTQAFVEACMEECLNLRKEARAKSSEPTVAGMAGEAAKLEKELRESDGAVARFESSNGVALLPDQEKTAGGHLANLNEKLAVMKSEYDLLGRLTPDQNLERRTYGTDAAVPAIAAIYNSATNGAGESDYHKATEQILVLKAERDDLGQYLRPKHPKMIALNDEIARQERLLDAFRQQNADQLASKRDSLALEIQNLEREAKEWDAKTAEIQSTSAEYQRLKANSARLQALYDRLLATIQAMNSRKEADPENMAILDPAGGALATGLATWQKLAAGGFAGLVAGLLLLFILDRMDDRMGSLAELEEIFDERVLAEIPREQSRGPAGGSGLIEARDTGQALAEAFRSLRSSMLCAGEPGQRPKTILVTSAIPGEGKSITATNLAIALANAGSRVLLIDADLRKGVLHSFFETPAQPGMSETLERGKKWQEAVWATKTANLFLLPRGAATNQAGELFAGTAADSLLREGAAQYEFVILDSPPVMAADDAATLAPRVEGTLFVIRADYTPARVAQAGIELLYRRQARLLGLVLNSVRASGADFRFYKYKDYYKNQPAAGAGMKV
jgi:succinoglycan biosynthesis transport protein ExoP